MCEWQGDYSVSLAITVPVSVTMEPLRHKRV